MLLRTVLKKMQGSIHPLFLDPKAKLYPPSSRTAIVFRVLVADVCVQVEERCRVYVQAITQAHNLANLAVLVPKWCKWRKWCKARRAR